MTSFLVWFIFCLCSVYVVSECRETSLFDRVFVDRKIADYFDMITCDSKLVCAEYCHGSMYCLGFSYKLSLGRCELSDKIIVRAITEVAEGTDTYKAYGAECESKGYQVFGNLGICLKLNTTEVIRNAAFDVCQEDGGYLLNANTDEIYSMLEQFTTDHNVVNVRLGGYGDISNGFEWSRGGLIKDEYWSTDEPNNYVGSEHCVSYHHEHGSMGLFDVRCNKKHPFICELLL